MTHWGTESGYLKFSRFKSKLLVCSQTWSFCSLLTSGRQLYPSSCSGQKHWSHTWLLFFSHTPHPTQEIGLALILKYIQNLTTSYHLHCCPSGPMSLSSESPHGSQCTGRKSQALTIALGALCNLPPSRLWLACYYSLSCSLYARHISSCLWAFTLPVPLPGTVIPPTSMPNVRVAPSLTFSGICSNITLPLHLEQHTSTPCPTCLVSFIYLFIYFEGRVCL